MLYSVLQMAAIALQKAKKTGEQTPAIYYFNFSC